MAFEQTLNTAAQFQAAAIQNSSIDTSSLPIKLALVSGTQQLIDDFNDGVRDPLWSTVGGSPQALVAFEPVGVNDWQEFLNRLGEGKDLLAQTFIPTQNFQLLTISMYLHNQSLQPADGVTVQIRTTDASGNPTSTVLASKFLATSSWPAPTVTLGLFSFSLVYFDLAVPLPLTAGQKYAIVLSPSWAPSSSSFATVLGSFNNYADGMALKFNGSSWSQVFNGGSQFLNDFHFRLTGILGGTEPVETGGFLQFDYPEPTGQKFIGVCRNQVLSSFELETRFIWDILASPANSSYEFGLHFLKGQIGTHTIDKDALLIWELIFSPTPTNGIFHIVPVMTDSSGTKRTFIGGGGGGWVPFDFQFGYLVGSPGNNVPVTFRVTKDQTTQGVKMLAYRNDDPQSVIFNTDASPPPRSLSGDYFFNIGLGVNINGSRFKFDYFKVPAAVEESPQGELILRHSFPTRSRITQLSLNRILPAPGSKINVRIRVADSIAQLDAQPFSDLLPTTVQGTIETGFVTTQFGLFCDTKLEFVRGSPGPELNSLTLTLDPEIIVPPPPPEAQAVGEDSPIIFSLDEVGPGLVKVTDSESGANETANTVKVKDGDPETQWVSQSSQDGQEVTLTIGFIDSQGNPVNRKLDAIYLRNTNIKQFRVHIGGTNLAAGDMGSEDSLVAFDEIETNSIQISASSTQVANESKKIGEIYTGRILLTLPGFSSYEPTRIKFQSGQFRAIGGRLIRFNGVSKYSSRWTVTLLSPQDKDQLEKIFKENEFVTFLPEPNFRPRDLFDVGWRMEELTFPYSEIFKVPGHTVEVQMEEI